MARRSAAVRRAWQQNVEMKLRVPPRLRRRLEWEAKRNGQSMNWEIVQRLGRSLEVDGLQRAKMASQTAEFIVNGSGLDSRPFHEELAKIVLDDRIGAGGKFLPVRSTDQVQLKVRLPGDVRLHLEREAARNDHSINKEILERLSRSFQQDAFKKGNVAAQAAEMIVRGLDDDVFEELGGLIERGVQKPTLGRRVLDHFLGRGSAPSDQAQRDGDKEKDNPS